jgi:hypothetical protein
MRHVLWILIPLALGGCARSSGGGGGGGPDPVNTTVAMDGLVVRVLDQYECEPNADGVVVQCADYAFQFTLRNDGEDPTRSLKSVNVSIDGDWEASSGPVTCEDHPWQLDTNDTSDAIAVAFNYQGIQDLPTLFHRCGDSQTARTGGGFGAAPLSGQATVELSGETWTLGDWSASATASFAVP